MDHERLGSQSEGGDEEQEYLLPGADEILADQERREQEEAARVRSEERDFTIQAAGMFGVPDSAYDRIFPPKPSNVAEGQKQTVINFDFADAAHSRKATDILNQNQGGT